MSEDKKSSLKVTLELEINERLIETMEDAMSKTHWKMPEMMGRGEEK